MGVSPEVGRDRGRRPHGPGDATPKDEHDDRPELDVDAAFAAIVADFGRPHPGGVGPWPAAEDVDDEADDEPADETAGPAADPGKLGGPAAPAQGTAAGAAEAAAGPPGAARVTA